jgi:hypothetical protein
VIGATLSRWTMSYFAAAMVALLGAEALMAWGYGFPAAAIAAPDTLVVVHLVAVGWLSLLMCGALFQFVPVLVARRLHSNSLPLPALVCLVVGLGALLLGFLQAAGQATSGIAFFPAAAVLLSVGFGLVVWNLARTLWAARPLPAPARFVVVGLFGLGATVAFGVVFTLVLGGLVVDGHLADVAANGVPLHAIAGLGAWLTFTAVGVSYRLLAMFMLAPEFEGDRPRRILYLGTATLAVAIVGGVAAICTNGDLRAVLAVSGALGLLTVLLYGRDILHLYRARKRRSIELNSRMSAVAFVNLAALVVLSAVLLALGEFERHIGALVFLAGFGWLSGLGLAQLYKIVAFLTWLECYGPVLGRLATPRVQDLVAEPRAAKWFALYFGAVWCAEVALLVEAPSVFRTAAGLMTLATFAIAAQFVRIRRLADVSPALRLSDHIRRPRMLLCAAR